MGAPVAGRCGVTRLHEGTVAGWGDGNVTWREPYLFQSIAATVIGGVYIPGGHGSYLAVAAGAASLTGLVSVLLAMDMPD